MPTSTLFVGPLDRVLFLRTLPALEALSSRQLVAIAECAREQFVPRGRRLMRARERSGASYVVLDGRLELAGDGERRVVENGGSLGLIESLAREPAEHDVTATIDTLVLELDTDDMEELWEDQFLILFEFVKYLAREHLHDFEQLVPYPDTLLRETAALGESELNLVELILTLRQIPLLTSESIDAIAELSGHLSQARVPAGDALWRQGDPPDHFWILLSGMLQVHSPPTSKRFDVGAGACAGMEQALAGAIHSTDALALDPLVTLRIERERFVDVLEDHFLLARELMAKLARRLLSRGVGGATSR